MLPGRALLLVGDPSSLPAIMTILESTDRPEDARTILLRDDAAHEIPLEAATAAVSEWVHRDREDVLDACVHAIVESWRPDYVWVAGEATTLKSARHYLRHKAGYNKDSSQMVGYWRRGSASDRYEGEVITRGQELLADGARLTPQDLDELSVEIA